MANYVKQELPNLNGKGEDRSYYRILKRGNVNNEQLIDRICNVGGSSLSRGAIIHVLTTVAEEMARQLADGYSVTLDGIGTFSATIGVKEGKEQDTFYGEEVKRNAKSLEVKNVTFRSDKELVKEVNRRCDLKRAGVFQIHRSKYNKEESLSTAEAQQRFISRGDRKWENVLSDQGYTPKSFVHPIIIRTFAVAIITKV